MIVRFSNVGRGHVDFIAECDNFTEEWAARQVKRNARVMSDDLAFENGVIFAGFHIIGTYDFGDNKT